MSEKGTGTHQPEPWESTPTTSELLDELIRAACTAASTPTRAPKPYDPAILGNGAVAITCYAYAQTLEKSLAAGKSLFEASNEAKQAFRGAMPPMSGAENIRDFIACISHGILIEAIPAADATRLLYAAQVASSALSKAKPKRDNGPTYTDY